MDERKKDDFRDLEVWQHCKNIRGRVWRLAGDFPKEEKYRLADQMIRSSRSATACLAEGYGRFHYQENIQFCRQSRGSLYELVDHIEAALECGYLSSETASILIEDIKGAVRLLNG